MWRVGGIVLLIFARLGAASQDKLSAHVRATLRESPCSAAKHFGSAEESSFTFDSAIVRSTLSSPNAPVVVFTKWRRTAAALRLEPGRNECDLPDEVDFKEADVPLITHATPNRLDNVIRQAARWQGPVHAAMLVCSEDDLQEISNTLLEERNIQVTLVLGHFPSNQYPANLLRNLALWSSAASNYQRALVLDADAIPNHSMRAAMNDIVEAALDDVTLGVVPAFQTSLAGVTSKAELVERLEAGEAHLMHQGRPSYAFDWVLWGANLLDIEYAPMNEPYVVVPLSLTCNAHPFDEAFVGRGFNKQSWHFELWASGTRLRSLRNTFVVDVANPPETQGNLAISPHMVQHWKVFRQDVSERYGLDCSQAQWRRCDQHGICDRVCSRRGGDALAAISSQRKPLHDGEAQGAEAFWSAFVQRLEDQAALPLAADSTRRFPVKREECLGQVDFVFTWVNGSDGNHRAARRAHIPGDAFDDAVELGNGRRMRDHGLEFRFRDFGPRASTLRFALLLVAKHAPWVRTIWVVTAGEVPQFSIDDARVRFVSHADIFPDPQTCLPTFNSCAIEANLHRIPGLSQCYFYSNDDVLLLRDLNLNEYWPQGEPVPRAVFDGGLLSSLTGLDVWQRKLSNVGRMLEAALPGLRWSELFTVGHTGHFFVRPAVGTLEALLQAEFDRTRCEKWRTEYSLWVPLAYSNWLAFAYPAKAKRETGEYFRLVDGKHAGRNLERAMVAAVESGSQWLCLNDIMGPVVPEEFTEVMARVLGRLVV